MSFDLIFQLQDLKNSFIEIQTEFQLQVKSLRADLEEEKQARVKLEAEVRGGATFLRILLIYSSSGQSFEETDPQAMKCYERWHLIHLQHLYSFI